jgi:hypothetical protein
MVRHGAFCALKVGIMAEETMYEWKALAGKLKDASESELELMLSSEKLGKARVSFLLRIYARYAIVRGRRERGELLAQVSDLPLKEEQQTSAKKKEKPNGRKVR